MATYATYYDHTPIARAAGSNAAGVPAYTIVENVFDAAHRNLVAADVVELVDIPAGTLVQKVFVQVENGEVGTIEIGDAADADGYVAAGDVEVAGTRLMGAGAFATGKFYAEAGKLLLTVPALGEFATLRIKVQLAVVQIG